MRQFTVIAAGDVLLHSGFWSQAAAAARRSGRPGYDFRPLLAPVRAEVSGADLAICHLETPLGRPAGPFTGYPVFSVPPQIATALRATGYDDCDTASNHSLDGGAAGVARTVAALDAAGITHTGSARGAAEAARTDLLWVAGVPVAHLAYTFSFNGIPLPRQRPWLANRLEVPRILADAHRAREAGAQVVIVSLHWGTEYQHAPDAAQLRRARILLSAPDIDLILGCHAHVVQPMERIGEKWVVYGMGNEVAWQPQRQDTRDGVMPRLTFTEVAPGRFRATAVAAVPTFMRLEGRTATLVDLPVALADPRLPAPRRAAYLASWQRTRRYLDARGAAASGLVVLGPG
jgi:poly-gamma-glutamate capsule biosynthesis protein CapA/YwtB (metallophosphatase superfamily)